MESAKSCLEKLVPSNWAWILASVVAGALVWLNDRFVFESVQITSSSMRPTLLPNERAYLQRVGVGDFHRHDVVVIDSPVLGHRIAKRIVGMPGDRVKLEDSWRVLENGKAWDYAPQPGTTNRQVEEGRHEILLERNPAIFYETKYGREELLLGPDE